MSCSRDKMQRVCIVSAIILVLATICLAICGCVNPRDNGAVNSKPYDVSAIQNEELSIHFLELGNKYKGECIYVKAGETDMLIDGGNRKYASTHVANYLKQYVADGKLEYVIVTHPHATI